MSFLLFHCSSVLFRILVVLFSHKELGIFLVAILSEFRFLYQVLFDFVNFRYRWECSLERKEQKSR
jgi:hypothetical protein